MIGDIVFFKNKSFISKAIKWFTTSNWSHVGCMIDYNNNMIEATWPRVKISNISSYKGCEYAVLRLKQNLTDEQKIKILDFLKDKIDKRYDWRGIISFVIKSNYQNKNWFFCSELVIEAYRAAGIELLRKETQWVTPQDLFETLSLEIVDKGII